MPEADIDNVRKLANTSKRLPPTKIVYYVESDGAVPIVEWLDGVPRKAAAKCQAYLARLQSEGHELRRPIADYLRDGIYELRPSLGVCTIASFISSMGVRR